MLLVKEDSEPPCTLRSMFKKASIQKVQIRRGEKGEWWTYWIKWGLQDNEKEAILRQVSPNIISEWKAQMNIVLKQSTMQNESAGSK